MVTAVRDEFEHLPRLAACLKAQSVLPLEWVIVDTGSSDGSFELAARLAERTAWIRVLRRAREPERTRGAEVAEAFEAGLAAIAAETDVVVKCDADVSFGAHHLDRLLARFAAEPILGIASGSRHEVVAGRWRQRFPTGASVEAACRAYRSRCLRELLPLEKSKGWDGIDEAKANIRGWRTRTFRDLPFRHHRLIGTRERSRLHGWAAEGGACHRMGYRIPYLLLRALFHAPRDPAAVALLWGYARAALSSAPRCQDGAVLDYFRAQQQLDQLPKRVREALGWPRSRGAPTDLLLVADPGGHLLELVLVAADLGSFSRTWVTLDKSDARSLLLEEQVYFAHGPTYRSIWNLLRNLLFAWRVVAAVRPRAVLTTGAGLAVPFAWVARSRGATVIFVEIFGATRLSLSCRLVSPVAARVYVQWPELATAMPNATYVGPPLTGRSS